MKIISACCLISLLGISNLAKATGQFVTLSSDQVSYAVGGSATLTEIISYNTSDADYDFYLAPMLNGVAMDANVITSTVQQVITPPFASTGTYDFEVDVYLQNKTDATNFQAAITFYTADIGTLLGELDTETNPTAISNLKAQLAEDRSIVKSATEQLNSIRRLVEIDHLQLNVNQSASLRLL